MAAYLYYTLTTREVRRDESSIDLATVSGRVLAGVLEGMAGHLLTSRLPNEDTTAVDMRLTWEKRSE
jgi:hypothetical protein